MSLLKSMMRIIVILMVTSSCSSLWPFGEKKEEPAAAPAQVAPVAAPGTVPATSVATSPVSGEEKQAASSAVPTQPVAATASDVNSVAQTAELKKTEDESSLKMARVMARMEEIEAELKRQREKVRLLEQGLLTGIAPDDLKKPSKSKHAREREDLSLPRHETEDLRSSKAETEDLSAPEIDEDLVAKNKKDVPTGSGGESAFAAKLQMAKENYQAGRFGLAIADLASLSREFGEKAGDGAIRLWLGKSYLGLKEYGTARGEFEAYLSGWPSGEHVPNVRIDLARVYVGLGLKERARKELRRVVKDFDGQEVAEIASLELKNLQGNL